MAPVDANKSLKPNTQATVVRPLANFPPSEWGDAFLTFSLDNSKLEEYAKAMEGPKEEVRSLIVDPSADTNTKMQLIYSVHRLGLSYIYVEEIDGQLEKLFKQYNMKDYEEADLYTISIHFQVFRQHGYKLSCDVFNKFRDGTTGTFKEWINSDVRGMLSLYESTHLRIRGEDILDEALAFTETQLEKRVNTVEGNLARQVNQALKSAFHRGIPIVEARLYLCTYEEESSTNKLLLKLAKVHFKYLQLLYKEELRIVSKWWKDMEFETTLRYVRDRVPEIYMWVLGLNLEPCCSQARIIATKITVLIVVLDDTYDAYATFEEIQLLTDAINRWDASAVEPLPEYIKPFYRILLNEYSELEKQFSKDGRACCVEVAKQAFQELARGYFQEAKWLHDGYVATFDEYMKNGQITSGSAIMSKSFLAAMGKIVNEEALAWYESQPLILRSSQLIARLQDDVMTFQFERQRGQSATGVDAYIKSYGVSEEVSIRELQKIIENAWKDLNEGCLKPTVVSNAMLTPILNYSRAVNVIYKFDDGFTFPGKTLKEYITLLLISSGPN